ncbi:hypothetical protein AYO39_02090 [Actinobacteria bacterium SCGC AG-212-D09]|nr:hypothetical protein AYO39_02090 [Actinobacteria bacterium SCGC AG-212-D09]
MASGAKRKTTFAKLAREQRVRERRLEKKARKDARKRAAENPETDPEQVTESDPDAANSVTPE